MADEIKSTAVELTNYDWHRLLGELEELMRIINRDRETTIQLYEAIASQLHGQRVVVQRAPAPPPVEVKNGSDMADEVRRGFWARVSDAWKGWG